MFPQIFEIKCAILCILVDFGYESVAVQFVHCEQLSVNAGVTSDGPVLFQLWVFSFSFSYSFS